MRVNFDRIKGQRKAKIYLSSIASILREERVDSLFLEFIGPDGVGKLTSALELARAVNCENGDIVPCGQCNTCLQFGQFQHPDLFILLPDMDEDKWEEVRKKRDLRLFYDPLKQIKINEIRDVERELWRERPYSARYRFVIVANGENLNQYAQNAFLKTLEEPYHRTILIFITSRPERVLPTIHSRARKIKFEVLHFEEFKSYFEGINVGVPLTLLFKLSGGSIGRAKRFLSTGFLDDRISIISAFISRDLERLRQAFAEFLERGGVLDDFVNFYGLVVRDISFIKFGLREHIINWDLQELLSQLAEGIREDILKEMEDAYRRLLFFLKSNVDEELIPYAMMGPLIGRSYRDVLRDY